MLLVCGLVLGGMNLLFDLTEPSGIAAQERQETIMNVGR